MNQIELSDSTIGAVEVFRSQALVTRRARIELGGRSGRCEALLAPLPFLLRDDSLRVGFPEPDGVRLVDLHIELLLGERAGPLRSEAGQRLLELERERVALTVELEREQDTASILRRLQPAELKEGELPDNLAFGERDPLPAWLAASDQVAERLAGKLAARRRLERRRRELDDAIARAHDELQAESQARAEELTMLRKAARLVFDIAAGREELPVELSYLVPAARWLPAYELRVEPDRDRAELVCRALVAQRSGEDWRQVELAFATADLERSARLPELESWRIGKRQPARPSGWRELPDTTGELFAGYDGDRGSLPPPEPPSLPELPEFKRLGPQLASTRELVRSGDQALQRLLERQRGAVAEIAASRAAPERQRQPEPVPEEPPEPEEFAAEMAADLDDEMPVMAAMAPPPAPPPRMSKKLARGVAARVREEAAEYAMADAPPAGALEPEEAEPSYRLAASEAALSYAELRMQGPEAGEARGQLLAVDPGRRLAELLAGTLPGSATEASAALLEAAREPAEQLAQLELPPLVTPLEQSSGHFAVRYTREGPGSIPADGRWHALALLRRSGDIKRVFRCVPLLDDNVYQLAEFANPLGRPLLAGPVRVYHGGDFLVTAPLQTTPPGKTLTVNLGVEPGIAVARNTNFEESTGGLLGGDTRLQHEVVIDVHNKLARPVQVEVFERIPVSHDKDITVELLSSSPRAEAYDQAERGEYLEGGLKFSLRLEPGEKRSCSLQYQITIPSKQVLLGGNRRD